MKPLFYVGIVFVFFVTVAVVLPQIIIRIAPESRLGYAFEYFISPDKVDVEPKPHDCEFRKAPIGNKCHFEKEVNVVKNERGEVTNVIVTWKKANDAGTQNKQLAAKVNQEEKWIFSKHFAVKPTD